MVATLGDGVVFRCNNSKSAAVNADESGRERSVSAEYMEELPISYFNEKYAGSPRLIWHFGYAQQRQSLHDSRRKGTLFQVHIWWHDGECNGCSANAGPVGEGCGILPLYFASRRDSLIEPQINHDVNRLCVAGRRVDHQVWSDVAQCQC
jgi:hypothetical protein